jgi:hypothetical protein
MFSVLLVKTGKLAGYIRLVDDSSTFFIFLQIFQQDSFDLTNVTLSFTSQTVNLFFNVLITAL